MIPCFGVGVGHATIARIGIGVVGVSIGDDPGFAVGAVCGSLGGLVAGNVGMSVFTAASATAATSRGPIGSSCIGTCFADEVEANGVPSDTLRTRALIRHAYDGFRFEGPGAEFDESSADLRLIQSSFVGAVLGFDGHLPFCDGCLVRIGDEGADGPGSRYREVGCPGSGNGGRTRSFAPCEMASPSLFPEEFGSGGCFETGVQVIDDDIVDQRFFPILLNLVPGHDYHGKDIAVVLPVGGFAVIFAPARIRVAFVAFPCCCGGGFEIGAHGHVAKEHGKPVAIMHSRGDAAGAGDHGGDGQARGKRFFLSGDFQDLVSHLGFRFVGVRGGKRFLSS